MSTFEETIVQIEARIVDLTWPGGLFAYGEFREIHSHPERYREAALRALAGETLTVQQKQIVALSMQKLPLAERIEFAHRVIDLFEERRISATLLRECIFPTYDWSTAIVEQYRVPEVASLLRRLAGLAGLDEQFARYLQDDVLTGGAKATVERLRDTGQIR
jgi:hypothetical protein